MFWWLKKQIPTDPLVLFRRKSLPQSHHPQHLMQNPTRRRFIKSAAARAFVPAPLPPAPPLEIDGELGALLDAASTALGRLDGISLLLPDPGLFLYTYVRKEAVLSSQIEGTQSSLSDLLSHELDNTPSGLL